MGKGPLIILSGPSGSGKSTVLGQLLASGDLPLRLSVSATTRAPRPGERDGVDYHFWDRARFEKELAADGFLESAEVHGNYYGTLRREVEPFRDRGVGAILDIDVQGWRQVRQRCPEVVSIFLRAPSLEAYEQRLRARGTETEASLKRRLDAARAEIAHAQEYDYEVINDDLEMAVRRLRDVVETILRATPHKADQERGYSCTKN